MNNSKRHGSSPAALLPKMYRLEPKIDLLTRRLSDDWEDFQEGVDEYIGSSKVINTRDYLGNPLSSFESGQRCKYCPTILSIYNPHDVCDSCISSLAKKCLGNPKYNKVSPDEMKTVARKILKAQRRKPLKRTEFGNAPALERTRKIANLASPHF